MGCTAMKAINPRTGESDYTFLQCSAMDVQAQAKRLRVLQPAWEALGPEGRAETLLRFAQAMERHARTIGDALAADTGRNRIARLELSGTIDTIRKWAKRGPELFTALPVKAEHSLTPGIKIEPRFSSYQLFGAIAPWNFPMVLSHVDTIPALMAGCAALVKPSEITPRFVEPMRAALDEVPELPMAYVLGGAETGEALVSQVDYVCFTGSVATGRKVAQAAARSLVPVNLELGGKDPMIITASADPCWAAQIALRASVVATGQACQSIERVYVARDIAEPFLAELVRVAQQVKLVWPNPDRGHLGPFIFPKQADKVLFHISDALDKGARLLTGGKLKELGGGKYLPPTVLSDVTQDMDVMREETFGPFIPVVIYDQLEDAIAQANDSIYGLSAAVLAGTSDEAAVIGARLDAGAISLQDGALTNMVGDAWNHSRKCSGLGPSRMGDEGMLRFLRRQALIYQTGQAMKIDAFAEEGVNFQ
ncbi:MAG: aldehyde dehydrogenase family protein [Sphingomonadaceae bacterium]